MEGFISTWLFHIINVFWNKRQSYSNSAGVYTSAEMQVSFQLSRYFLLVMTVTSFIRTSKGTPKVIDARGKGVSRDEHSGISFANFKAHKFSYLNITCLATDYVLNGRECGLACVNIPSCFSFNLAAFYDITGKILCELLPSDKYNNSDKFVTSKLFHHFSIRSPCMNEPCLNNGTCISLYKKNSYACICKLGYTGRNCETDIDECNPSIRVCDVNANCQNTGGSYDCSCKAGFTGDGKTCNIKCSPVGISSPGIIPDNQMTASSEFSYTHKAYYGRINGTRGDGWCSKIRDSKNDWLQIDFGKVIHVCGVATQGDRDGNAYTTDFELSFSADGSSWTPYKDDNNTKVEFHREGDSNSIDQHKLPTFVSARYIRFHPVKRHNWNCLRVEVYGTVVKDCAELYKSGQQNSGVYTINPDGSGEFDVYCDQTTAGGGWTVFQKRQDGSVDFYRGWVNYKQGFGKLNSEFWLGLDKIHRLTNSGNYKLRVDLEDFTGNTAYAEYGSFGLSDEGNKYRLSVGSYSGTAGDSLTYHNGYPFTTQDQDNDNSGNNCALSYKGAWWYNGCYKSNLNGIYHQGQYTGTDSVTWYYWKRNYDSAKRAEMKIRPLNF